MRRRVAHWKVMGLTGFTACVLSSIEGAEPPASQRSPASAPYQVAVARSVYAITHVNVLPMTLTGAPVLNASVVIAGERISSINGPVPQAAKVIDGKGKW